MAAGASSNPPAQAGEFERLRIVPEGIPIRAELIFQRRTIHASLDAGGPRDFIDLQDFIEMPQVDRHRTTVGIARGRFDPTDNTRSAAKRNRRSSHLCTPVE